MGIAFKEMALRAVATSSLRYLVLGSAFSALAATPAWSHASDKGFVLLLPTHYYIVGGTLAVAASFLLLLAIPDGFLRRIATARLGLGLWPAMPRVAISAVSFLLLILLLIAGVYGSRDPLENPLPLFVWTIWWGGLTIAQALFGNLWGFLNPWLAPYRLIQRLSGDTGSLPGLLRYPPWFGYGPAILLFLGFAWFELIDPAPDDPARLAQAILVYSAITSAGMVLFGERAWLAKGDCFSVFFRFVALLAPLRAEPVEPDPSTGLSRRYRLSLGLPGRALLQLGPLPLSGALFVLLTLATVSFDGLDKTFWWLGAWGVNPLEYPGRTDLMLPNSLGLIGAWLLLSTAYGLAMGVGARLAGGRIEIGTLLGAFVLSILPISIGYHFAHYLTSFLVNAQYAVFSIDDPFGWGWHLLGIADPHVRVSFLSDMGSVWLIFSAQAAAVALVHILAVLLAHLIAIERFPDKRAALASQWPLALLMIGYTLFGLWLLAAPTIG
jgi:hypothetical protein